MPGYGSGDYRHRLAAGPLEGKEREEYMEKFEAEMRKRHGDFSMDAEELKKGLMEE